MMDEEHPTPNIVHVNFEHDDVDVPESGIRDGIAVKAKHNGVVREIPKWYYSVSGNTLTICLGFLNDAVVETQLDITVEGD